ncbi:MAG: putative N6-adenine-specific methylase [Deltaproteobacteria bacterium]|nr:putative N6-adenine-specific methylase [Deltaproteobacteria bacterium]
MNKTVIRRKPQPLPKPFPGKHRLVVTCAKGILPYLKQEILDLGFPILSESIAGIETAGTFEDTLKLNLYLRTAQHVLFLLEHFKAVNAEELYREISVIPWEEYLSADQYLCLTSSVDNPTIRDTRYANLKAKDAIVDRLRAKTGRRPDSGPQRTGAVVTLYWRGTSCRISIDTSGEPLSHRGYRKIPLQAPLQETLAAGVLLAAGWKGDGNLVNPMCGSGTLAIEGALIAAGRPPGFLRENFGFMHVRGFDRKVWLDLLHQAEEQARGKESGRMIATDINPEAVEGAKKNAAAAGVGNRIEFQVCDFAETPIPEGGGVVLLNPEYGERLGKVEKLVPVYQGIGDFFKKKCLGYRGFVFTGNPELAKKIGLKASRKIPFFNSNIECRLLEYDLYPGSREI